MPSKQQQGSACVILAEWVTVACLDDKGEHAEGLIVVAAQECTDLHCCALLGFKAE